MMIYLAHHGIKGMKLGSHRYQYKDGSLTQEGRLRYGVGEYEAYRYAKVNEGKRSGNSSLKRR